MSPVEVSKDSEQVRVITITTPQRRFRFGAKDMVKELVDAKAIQYIDQQFWIISKGTAWQHFVISLIIPSELP